MYINKICYFRLDKNMSSRRKHSSLWMHFVEDTSSKKAKCKYCSSYISTAGGSNGNLTRHMKTKHPSIPLTLERQDLLSLSNADSQDSQESNQFTSRNLTSPSPVTSSSSALAFTFSQNSITQYIRKPPPIRKVEEIDRQVVKMIAKGHHALRIVEEPEMRKLIQLVSQCPGYQLPSRKTLSTNLMLNVHQELLNDARKKISDAVALSLTTDAWTSSNNESYMAVTAHFVDDETKLCSILLTCETYDDRHTSENLCEFLKNVMKEWDISHKVTAIVSDNAANIINAIKLGQWRSIGCFAHTLNLIVQTATKEIADVLTKVKNIVEYFNRSTQGQKKLITTQQQLNLPLLKLKQDVPTRWNSTYDMLQRIIQVKDAVITTIALLRSDLIIKQEDWEIIEEVLPLLQPFYEVTVEISAEKNVSLSKVIVFNNLIQDFLKKYASQNDKIIAVQLALKRGMETRFRDLENNILYAESTILDPRFKARALKNSDYRERAIEGLKNKVGKTLLQAIQNNDQEISSSTTALVPISATDENGNKQNCMSIWDEYDSEISRITRPENKTVAGIREVDKYLNEEYLDRKKDPLFWWHERRFTYPHLYGYILKRFCIVATSVPCERVFSGAGQIISQRRKLLKPNKVSTLLFLHSNM